MIVARRSSYRSLANRDRRLAIATAAMLAAGLVHALYITAIGGDYMHGRLLLPAFFALGAARVGRGRHDPRSHAPHASRVAVGIAARRRASGRS